MYDALLAIESLLHFVGLMAYAGRTRGEFRKFWAMLLTGFVGVASGTFRFLDLQIAAACFDLGTVDPDSPDLVFRIGGLPRGLNKGAKMTMPAFVVV
jgi:hypothetical protein